MSFAWQDHPMQESMLLGLQSLRPSIRARWLSLLRELPVNSPLASPDVLSHLMDWTLDEVFKVLTSPPTRRRPRSPLPAHPGESSQSSCRCGRNPLESYFSCLHQALNEAVNTCIAALENNSAEGREISFAEAKLAVSTVAARGWRRSAPSANTLVLPRKNVQAAPCSRSRYDEGDSPAIRRKTRLN